MIGLPERPGLTAEDLARTLRRLRPTVEDVVGAALHQAQLDEGEAPRWRRRLRWAALLPRLTGRFSHTSLNGDSWDISAASPDRLALRNALALQWELRATWDLTRLLFDARELRVSARASRLALERERLVERVVRLYFERVRLLVLTRDAGGGEQLERMLALRETTAQLDALTGGLLTASERAAEPRR